MKGHVLFRITVGVDCSGDMFVALEAAAILYCEHESQHSCRLYYRINDDLPNISVGVLDVGQ
jgi:hypothetical protein